MFFLEFSNKNEILSFVVCNKKVERKKLQFLCFFNVYTFTDGDGMSCILNPFKLKSQNDKKNHKKSNIIGNV